MQPGESVVLLGANGAGKTTLLKVLLGLMPAWGGRIVLDGGDVTRLRTDRRVRQGVAYMSELAVFPGLSIDENMRIGGQFAPAAALRTRMDELYATFPDLARRRGTAASSLSGGQRKMLGHRQGTRRVTPAAGDGRTERRPVAAVVVSEVLSVLGRFPRHGPGAADRGAERGVPGPGGPGLHAGGRADRVRGQRGGAARG